MKRIICFLICLIVTLSFVSCSSDTTVISGNYYAVGDYEKLMTPYLRLDTNENKFSLSAGSVISYAESGTYEIIDGKLIATTQSTTFEFEIKNKKSLVLTDNGDYEFFKIPNGTKFVFSKDLK